MKLNKPYSEMASDRKELWDDINTHYQVYRQWREKNEVEFSGKPLEEVPDDSAHLGENGTSDSSKEFNRFMEVLFNDLAKQWDNRINKAREEKYTAGYPESKHRFYIHDTKKKSAPVLIKSKTLLPPDKRTGDILCSFKGRNRIIVMSILHEMGHSIGKREREYRFQFVFLPMLAERLIFEISARMCGSIGDKDTRRSNEIIRHSSISFEKKGIVYHIYQLLPELQETLTKQFKESKTKFIKWYDKCLEKTSDNNLREIINRQKESAEMGFFINCRGIVLDALCQVLDTQENNEKTFFIRALDSFALDGDTIYEELKRHFDDLQKECLDAFEKEYAPVWYRDAEEILEETAADIFMLRICGTVSSHEYCHLLMKGLQKKYTQKIEEQSLLEQIAMPSNLLRFISVCRAIESHTGHQLFSIRNGNGLIDKYDKGKKFVCSLLQLNKIVERITAYKYLKQQYRNIMYYMTEEDEPPVLLRNKYYYLCYSPATIRRYFDYVEMIWGKYDSIFKEYENNEEFMYPIEQIRREVKLFSIKNRNKYLEHLEKTPDQHSTENSTQNQHNTENSEQKEV